jgi:hypothetical protein
MENATPDGALTHISYDINTVFIDFDPPHCLVFLSGSGPFLQKWDKEKIHRRFSKPKTSKLQTLLILMCG